MWPFKSKSKGAPIIVATPTTEAERALVRAREANREADIRLAEMQVRTERSRNERATNHFGPLILKAMGDHK